MYATSNSGVYSTLHNKERFGHFLDLGSYTVSSKVWILNSHGLIVIKAHLLIGDIVLIRGLMFDIESHITPTGAVATRLIIYSSEDLHITNSDSHMAHYNMCLRHTKGKVRDIMSNICLRISMNHEEEISKLEAEAQKQTGSGGLIVVILDIEKYLGDAIESWLDETLGKNGSCEIKWGGNFTKQGSLDYGAAFGFGLYINHHYHFGLLSVWDFGAC
ncbi:uncharacterized protein LOC112200474 [Rosa chinensis]|uniref:uncharacterized protein LOC112200474 n=1 Tax=Rosa chinensis TaxID=74649 RepID=UPI000D091A5F|nr:uncharacterized protein LOC112200474 [Rosa chinensis]